MEEPRFQLTRGDAVTWLRTLPAASIDLAITDPPYESLEKHRAVGTTTRLKHSKASSNDWFSIFPNARFPELFSEIYRVLKKDAHFYLFCDPETMFVAKPVGEQAGFKFWKPLIWDKCLGPETLVATTRGAVRIDQIVAGELVASPEGGFTSVRATRRTKAPSVRISLSDGTEIVASREHRFLRSTGELVEAAELRTGDALCTRPVREKTVWAIHLDDVIPEEDAVHVLPDVTACLWCGEKFENSRAAAAHQARWCEAPVSKLEMAEQLGIDPKRLRRWMHRGRLPRKWAKALGLEDKLGSQIQCYLQNDVELWYPRVLELNYEFGKFIGLYAAEGCCGPNSVSFSLHADEKHLHNAIARFVRSLGVRARLEIDGNKAVVNVGSKLVKYLIKYFVGGERAPAKFFHPTIYATPEAFRHGVLDGMIEGDGHWSHEEQRESYVSTSADLAMYARRELEFRDRYPTVRRLENDHAGAWQVRFDPIRHAEPTTVTAIEDIGEQELVDISVAAADQLFVLANGIVTHNCKIGMGYHYRARYECVLFFEKGKRKLDDLGIADIIQSPRISGGYPAEKPPEVSEVLVTQSTERGQLVIDPFCGSGSVGVAATRHGRDFAGNDLCEEAIDITRRRLLEGGAREGSRTAREPSAPQLGLTL